MERYFKHKKTGEVLRLKKFHGKSVATLWTNQRTYLTPTHYTDVHVCLLFNLEEVFPETQLSLF